MLIKTLQVILIAGLGVAAYQGMRPDQATFPVAAEVVTPLMQVQVSGQVQRPGLVQIPKGSRVIEAILKAGGVTKAADTAGLNLSRVLEDGEKVHVPRQGETQPQSVRPQVTRDQPDRPSSPVSLNRATLDELMSLPGIGEKKAKWIMQGRPYRSLDDLGKVKGFGPKTLERLKPLLTL